MNIKRFLKSNEIYFNTITTFLLGLMAIIVAYNSNKIANEQKLMNYYENMPDFHLSQEFKKDSSGFSNEVSVKVSKFGGKAKNVSIKIKTFALFEIMDEQNNKLTKYIPISGYFNESYRNGKNIGEIGLLKGIDNNKRFVKFKRKIESEILKKGYSYVSIDTLFIVRVNYTDFLNNEITEYYDVSTDDGVLIEKTDFRIKLFENNTPTLDPISISTFNDEKIGNYLKIILN